tara:strand:+ start:819 stop:1253 length:435 start_codon:yes stop_codon:yes gene_type:complete
LNNDYLKYWRVIRQYIKIKYGLTQSDLDVILFLNSEDYFSKDKFEEFDRILSWDENRFNKLLRDGWVEVFRKRKGKTKGLYNLSYKAKRVITSVYKKLNGEELPTSPSQNPMFLKNVSYSDRRYREAIINMNEFIRQQRHLSPE